MTFKWSPHTPCTSASMKITELKYHSHLFLRNSTVNKIIYDGVGSWLGWSAACAQAWILSVSPAIVVCIYNPGLDGQLTSAKWWGLGSVRGPALKNKGENRGRPLMLPLAYTDTPKHTHTQEHIHTNTTHMINTIRIHTIVSVKSSHP